MSVKYLILWETITLIAAVTLPEYMQWDRHTHTGGNLVFCLVSRGCQWWYEITLPTLPLFTHSCYSDTTSQTRCFVLLFHKMSHESQTWTNRFWHAWLITQIRTRPRPPQQNIWLLFSSLHWNVYYLIHYYTVMFSKAFCIDKKDV